MKVQPAVRQETAKIVLGTGILTVLMIAVFLIIRRFDWTVLTGALLGCAAAVGNFFLMALTVQKAADDMKPIAVPEAETADGDEETDEDEKEQPLSEDAKRGKQRVQLSYTLRMLGLGVIAILGVTLPWFHPIAVLLPLLFPRLVIALEGVLLNGRNTSAQ
ncbi:MAG: hypothetical protein II879_06570 [Clostridia bacterium]|nr:hypothetical protein [Clostridia bacterium]